VHLAGEEDAVEPPDQAVAAAGLWGVKRV